MDSLRFFAFVVFQSAFSSDTGGASESSGISDGLMNLAYITRDPILFENSETFYSFSN